MGTSSLSIATQGLAPSIFSAKRIALFGYGFIDVIITPVPIPVPQQPSYGGGGQVVPGFTYDVTFIIQWNGKTIRRTYTNLMFDAVIKVVAKFKQLSISARYSMASIINTLVNVKLNSTKTVSPITASATEKPLEIKAKRIKK